MADFRKTRERIERIEHIGRVVVPAAVLAQRRHERDERQRLLEVARTTIAGRISETTAS